MGRLVLGGCGEIGYAYPMVRPPLVLDLSLSSFPSLDGGELQGCGTLGEASLLLQAYAGQTDYQRRFFSIDGASSAALNRPVGGMKVSPSSTALIQFGRLFSSIMVAHAGYALIE